MFFKKTKVLLLEINPLGIYDFWKASFSFYQICKINLVSKFIKFIMPQAFAFHVYIKITHNLKVFIFQYCFA